jgi:gliding motility-associated-like protein
MNICKSTVIALQFISITVFGQVTFPAVTSLNAPDIPYEVAQGDFNNDGKPDLITANFTDDVNQQLTLLLSNNTGTFTGANFRNVAASTEVLDVATGDFNKDGNLDAVACSPQNNNFSFLSGNGTGSFAPAVNISTIDQPQGIAVGDMNKDTNLDVVISHIGTPDDVYIFFGNGAGGFSAPMAITTTTAFGYDIAVADFNGDTNPDFALSTAGGFVVQIWNGNGQLAPAFTLGQSVTGFSNTPDVDARDLDNDGDMDILADPGYAINDGTGNFASCVALPQSRIEFAAGDLNGDGNPDIAAVDFSTSIHPNIVIFSGDGTGAFTRVAKFEILCSVRGLEILDINNDGNSDVVAVGGLSAQGRIDILLGDGTGYFSNAIIKYPMRADPRDLVKGDFNEDGLMDVALCHSTGVNNISVFFGQAMGRFSESTSNYTAGIFPFQIMALDYNKDNHLDLITYNQSASSSLTVLTGLGNGQFTVLPDIPVASTFGRLASADFNNDTYVDLVVTGGTARVIYLITGSATGFNPATSIPVTQDIYNIQAADFNGDANQDLAVFFYTINKFVMLTGNGAGAFTEGTQYDARAGSFLIHDINEDGIPDVNAYDSNAGNDFFINDGTGVFTGSAIGFPFGGNPQAFADMNGDGFKDMILGTQFSSSSQRGTMAIYRGTATGPNALSALIIKDNSGGNRLLTHDVNGDGKEDIIATSFNSYEDYLSILLNTTGPAACTPPSISFVSPSPTACNGDDVSLSVSAAGTSPFSYQWRKGASVIAGATSSSLILTAVTEADEMTYTCVVTNTCGNVTSSGIVVSVTNKPNAPAVTGAGSCTTAAVTLNASGSTNGNYRWYGVPSGGSPISGAVNNTYTTPVLGSTALYYVSVINGTCESLRTPVTATIGGIACSNQPPVFNTALLNVEVSGTATIDLLTLISDVDNNVDANSLRVILSPGSGALTSISNGLLTIDYAGIDFSGPDNLTIEVCDQLGSCVQQQLLVDVTGSLIIFNAISPTADGLNDIWVIKNIELLPKTKNNKVSIFNRWGDNVFSVTNYDNKDRVFKGAGKNGNELPSGTYFYKIEFNSDLPTKTGYLVLKR